MKNLIGAIVFALIAVVCILLPIVYQGAKTSNLFAAVCVLSLLFALMFGFKYQQEQQKTKE